MRIVVGITGASGAIYGIRLLEELKKNKIETHLVISKWGKETIKEETNYELAEVKKWADFFYEEDELSSLIASGSFDTDGMIVCPCSMKTLAGISMGYSDNLIMRAADVTIKERRKLVLIIRESPLSPLHLENMLKLSRIGVTIMPPMPLFYKKPKSIEEIIEHTVNRVIAQFKK